MKDLRRVAIRVPRERGEETRAALLDHAPRGFEECEAAGLLEFAVYTDAAGEGLLAAAFGEVRSEPVQPGWEYAWRAFHRPVVVAGVWIGPPWEEPPPGTPAVVIDPGQAFGTGAHPTTRLCVELLATVPRGSLLDIGCGSGVVALAAARLGFGPLTAVDDDPLAVEAATANATVNGVALDARLVDAAIGPLPSADVAVANILLDAVERIVQGLDATRVVTSGYAAGEGPRLPGWARVGRREVDGWAADLFRLGSV